MEMKSAEYSDGEITVVVSVPLLIELPYQITVRDLSNDFAERVCWFKNQV